MNLDESVALRDRLRIIQIRLEQAVIYYGRKLEEIELLPISKHHTTDKITVLSKLGYHRFGENYAQEMCDKAKELHTLNIEWVFVGQLQSNKIAKIVEVASEIQTIASEKHLRYVSRYAREFRKDNFPVYISVNADQEVTKAGTSFKDAVDLARLVKERYTNLALKGIMAIPSASKAKRLKYCDESTAREIPDVYTKLSLLAATVGDRRLSLGMSADLEFAIAAGSTCLRIGTGIFGQRPTGEFK